MQTLTEQDIEQLMDSMGYMEYGIIGVMLDLADNELEFIAVWNMN